MGKLKVLFLCTGNSCRSQMAEGWVKVLRPDLVDAYSAGVEPHGMNAGAGRDPGVRAAHREVPAGGGGEGGWRMRRYVAEAIGTFGMVFAGTGAVVVDSVTAGGVTHVGVALTFGLVVMAMIYAVGDVS